MTSDSLDERCCTTRIDRHVCYKYGMSPVIQDSRAVDEKDKSGVLYDSTRGAACVLESFYCALNISDTSFQTNRRPGIRPAACPVLLVVLQIMPHDVWDVLSANFA